MAAESEVLVPAIKDSEKEKDTSKSPEATMNVTPTHLEADTPLQMQYFKVTPHQHADALDMSKQRLFCTNETGVKKKKRRSNYNRFLKELASDESTGSTGTESGSEVPQDPELGGKTKKARLLDFDEGKDR